MSTHSWQKTTTNHHFSHLQHTHPQLQQHSLFGVNQLPAVKIETNDVYDCDNSLSSRAHAAVVAAVATTKNNIDFNTNKNQEYASSEEDTEYVYDNGDNKSSSTKDDMNNRKECDEYDDEYYSDESENDRNNNQHKQNMYQNSSTSNKSAKKSFGESVTSNNNRKYSLDNVDTGNGVTNSSTSSSSSNETNANSSDAALINSKNGLKTPGLVCVVCGASANGYNFDRITCESCKAFFRRNAFRPLVSSVFFVILVVFLTIPKSNQLSIVELLTQKNISTLKNKRSTRKLIDFDFLYSL